MIISRIIIKKFRSIKKADVWASNLNAIVGQNNSGKSCLLRALNSFFNYEDELDAFSSGSHLFAAGTVAKIELHFSNVQDLDIPSRFSRSNKIIVETSFRINGESCTRTVRYKSGNSWVTDDACLDEIKKHIEFILIPPNRDASALNRVGNSVLNLLVEEKMQEATEARDNYSSKFRGAIQYLENNALRRISEATKKAFPVTHPIGMKIAYTKDISYANFLSDFGIYIDEEGLTHPLSDCGSGIQSLAIISLYNQLGDIRKENIIIGLEEPETNLHPQAQKELIDYFKNLIEEENILQFFFTTHSAQMIDQIDHTEIILFWKNSDSTRGFTSEVRRLPEDFFERYGLSDFNYYQFYRYRNSEFFFASHIIVTESKTEIEAIKKIGEISEIDYEVNGLSYLNLDGVDKAKYAIHLLNELQIPYMLVVDKDFFCPYQNDKLADSRGTNGFPIYRETFKDENLLRQVITNADDRANLLGLVNSNHTAMLNLLEEYGVISMRYNLELDLVAVDSARQAYFDLIGLPEAQRTSSHLASLKAIKKLPNILQVLDEIGVANWPRSYSRIRRMMQEISTNLG